MGFSAYQELGFDRVLLVEGPSDVTTVTQLLRLYGKAHSVAILSLGGASRINEKAAIELEQLKRITTEVSVLIDSERPKKGAALESRLVKFRDLCTKLGFKCHILERRAMENYFPKRALQEHFGPTALPLKHYERPKDRAGGRGWPKAENWRIARLMNLDELEGTDLGDFLEKL